MARPTKNPVAEKRVYLRQVEADALALVHENGNEISRKFYYRANPDARVVTKNALEKLVPVGHTLIDESDVEVEDGDWRSDPTL